MLNYTIEFLTLIQSKKNLNLVAGRGNSSLQLINIFDCSVNYYQKFLNTNLYLSNFISSQKSVFSQEKLSKFFFRRLLL